MSSEKKPRLILLELNEINFDVARYYVNKGSLPAFSHLLQGTSIRTSSEQHYELLEPWIQWPSVHSGLTAQEHGVFRLGDIVGSSVPQLFEQLEKDGVRVGCVSAMNAENRLSSPAYFMPDPWTKTSTDGSWWSRVLTAAIAQSVNDNARAHISWRSALHLLLGLGRFAQAKHYSLYWKLISGSRKAGWRKAMVLDLLLHDIHMHLFSSRRPAFSTLFLNAGAHIQHHYFFNSTPVQRETGLRNPTWYVPATSDPVAEMLEIYDAILSDYLALPDAELIVATGLSQQPYDRVKFYYRLRDHAGFLRNLGIPFSAVLPRMTRDFLVEFESEAQALAAQERLACLQVTGCNEPLFGEIDNRGKSLFVTLTYPNEIDSSVSFVMDGTAELLAPHVVFVAIKNGMHQATGFSFFSPGIAPLAPTENAHVKSLHSTIRSFFGTSTRT